MALTGAARVEAIYSALAAQPRNNPVTGEQMRDAQGAPVNMLDGMNAVETRTLRSNLTALFGTDTTYLTTNAVILPGTMVAPPGATVQVAVPAGTGATTGPSPTVTGAGRLS